MEIEKNIPSEHYTQSITDLVEIIRSNANPASIISIALGGTRRWGAMFDTFLNKVNPKRELADFYKGIQEKPSVPGYTGTDVITMGEYPVAFRQNYNLGPRSALSFFIDRNYIAAQRSEFMYHDLEHVNPDLPDTRSAVIIAGPTSEVGVLNNGFVHIEYGRQVEFPRIPGCKGGIAVSFDKQIDLLSPASIQTRVAMNEVMLAAGTPLYGNIPGNVSADDLVMQTAVRTALANEYTQTYNTSIGFLAQRSNGFSYHVVRSSTNLIAAVQIVLKEQQSPVIVARGIDLNWDRVVTGLYAFLKGSPLEPGTPFVMLEGSHLAYPRKESIINNKFADRDNPVYLAATGF